MAITELITGGFGDLGQAAGAAAEDYRTQMDYNKLSAFVEDMFRQGASPQQAAEAAKAQFPQLAGSPNLPSAPRPGVPGMNQPNVVDRTIGPSSPMQPAPQNGGMGTLGAQPSAPPQPPAPDPRLTARPSGGRIVGSPLELNGAEPDAPTPYPETAPRPAQPQNRVQQTSPVRSQATPPAQGAAPQSMAGLITPRNMPLAQLILQQKSQQRAQAVEMEKAKATNDLRAAVESMKEEGRNARTVYGAEAKSNLASANIASLMQRAELQNDTRVMDILMRARTAYAKLEQEAKDDTERGAIARAKLAQTAPALKALTQAYGASMNAYRGTMDPAVKALADAQLTGIYTLLGDSEAYEERIKITPGKTEIVQEPGKFFGTNPVKKETPPSAKIPGKAPTPGPAAPTAADLLKRRRESRTPQPTGR